MLNDRIALFCECFGDSDSTARKFFACSDILNVSLYEDNRLAAMASLVPILAVDDDILGYYIYGVCVAPDMRGRGLFKKIMSRSEMEARENGAYFVCLVPADAGLAKTYRKMGYVTEIFQNSVPLKSKILRLASDEFRSFARSDDNTTIRKNGLLKIIDDKAACISEGELCFFDDMGDV